MPPRFYAAICAIAKDEDAGLREWVDYHFAIGFEKIVIFDNNSATSVREILADHVAHNVVDVYDVTTTEAPQLSAYAAFLNDLGSMARWVAFIDIDEYICMKETTEIGDLLMDYEGHPALGISWKIFGSNGHLARPGGSPVEQFPYAIKDHTLIKSIIQPAMTQGVASPHHFLYRDNRPAVNEHLIPLFGPNSYHTAERVQINHYYYKSQQEFEDKIRRGFATRIHGKDGYGIEEFYEQAAIQGTLDTCARRFMPKTKLYRTRGAELIAETIAAKITVDVPLLLEVVSQDVGAGKIDRAIAKLRRACRYKDEPTIHTALATLHAANKDFRKAFGAVAEALSRVPEGSDTKTVIYHKLAQIYEQFGFDAQSRAILSEINTTGTPT